MEKHYSYFRFLLTYEYFYFMYLYRTAGVSGQINTNKKTSCYLMQDDYHQPFLNVFEMMTMACNLKLKSGNKIIFQKKNK